jgi:hypothetical protein
MDVICKGLFMGRLSCKKYHPIDISYLNAMLFTMSQPNMTQLGFDIFRNLD